MWEGEPRKVDEIVVVNDVHADIVVEGAGGPRSEHLEFALIWILIVDDVC